MPNIWGVPCYAPDRCEHETDESIAMHLENLRKQSLLKPCHQDQRLIHVALVKTFPERRKLVTGKPSENPISELAKLYAPLLTLKSIKMEFKQVMKMDLLPCFEAALSKLEDKALMMTSKKKENEYLRNLRSLIEKETNGEMRSCKCAYICS